jgi:septum formation protein
MTPLILASESPRRREILQYFAIPFEQIPHTADERSIPWQGIPDVYVEKLAEIKARDVATRHPNRLIVSADTIVVIDGVLLNKPKDKDEAISMLRLLSGKWHSVFTSVAISYKNDLHIRSEKTNVLIRPLSEQNIHAYLDAATWSDKAGAYAIQGVGSLLIHRIDGCYYNELGLPVGLLSTMLHSLGIDIWNYLK